MIRGNKDGKEQTWFDTCHWMLNYWDDRRAVSRVDKVVDFLSELKDKRTSTGTLPTSGNVAVQQLLETAMVR